MAFQSTCYELVFMVFFSALHVDVNRKNGFQQKGMKTEDSKIQIKVRFAVKLDNNRNGTNSTVSLANERKHRKCVLVVSLCWEKKNTRYSNQLKHVIEAAAAVAKYVLMTFKRVWCQGLIPVSNIQSHYNHIAMKLFSTYDFMQAWCGARLCVASNDCVSVRARVRVRVYVL